MKRPIFQAPYHTWTPEEILAYYQSRTHVRYFAVRDAEQATPEQIAGILDNRFTFNGETYRLPAHFDWTCNPSPDKEWLILLHKFYYAVGLGDEFYKTQERRYLDTWTDLTTAWIEAVPLDFLSSDVTARRILHWIYAHYYFITRTKSPHLSPHFYLKFLMSLHDQVNYLCHHLTPARNHRTIELSAVFFAAVVFPEFQDAACWLALSRQELLKNLQADLLADGVQCELSTDYHHLVLRNYLHVMKLAALNAIAMPDEMDILCQKALEFAKYIHKPDGTIPALSDGDVSSFREVLALGYQCWGDEELRYVATGGEQGRPPALHAKAFPAGGYVILRSGWGDHGEPFTDERYLVFDCGPLGAGNHGHLDLLSIEAAAYGHSLIVDPGRYTYYEPSPESGEINWRARFRGTGCHNTVLVDGKNQTRYEFQKTRFRICGPAPDHELKLLIASTAYDFAHGVARSHEYPVVHERKILFARPTYWIITDILRAAEIHTYDLRFHLSDSAQDKVTAHVASETIVVESPHLVMAQPCDPQTGVVVEDTYISRTYGVKHPAPLVRFVRKGATVVYHTVLYPYRTDRPQITVTSLPVRCEDRPCAASEASALLVTIRQSGQIFTDLYFSAGPNLKRTYSFANRSYNDSLLFSRWQQAMDQEARPLKKPGFARNDDDHS
jgi:hypothetical protein